MNKLKLLAVLPLAAGTVMLGAQAANAAAPSITISPTSGPNGTSVTATVSGFSGTPNVLQCKSVPSGQADAIAKCDVTALHAPGAAFKIDSNYCTGNTCIILAGTTDGTQAHATFTLGSASSNSGSSNSGSSDTGAGSTTADPAVNAGTGGQADREGVPAGVIAIAAIGAVAIAGGAIRFARR